MATQLIELILNWSMLFAMAIAPSIFLVSVWYRRGIGKAIFSWLKPEMVLLTIVFFIITLMIFIVGVSCFFTHFGYLDPIRFPGISGTQFFDLGVSCMLVIAGLAMVYFALRNLLMQMVQEDGMVMHRGIVPTPRSVRMLDWADIVDYYIVPDYPNVSFTFIIRENELRYDRQSVKVPIYLKEDFQAYLDKKIYAEQSMQSGTGVSSSRYFSEN